MNVIRLAGSRRWFLLFAAVSWIAGAIAVYSQLPVEPRAILPMQATRDIGTVMNGQRFLNCGSDGGTIGISIPEIGQYHQGPINLWDTQSGRLIATHLNNDDTFLYFEMRGHRLRLLVSNKATPAMRTDYFLDLQSGQMTPAGNQPEFGTWTGIHPNGDFIVCNARSPRTGLDWVDLETGQIIRSFPDASLWFRWTADLSHYVYLSGGDLLVARVTDHAIIARISSSHAPPLLLSTKTGILVDYQGKVWDVTKDQFLWRDTTNSFRNSGVELTADESAFVWRKRTNPWEIVHVDARSGREVPGKSFRLSRAEEGPFGGPAGSYWIACVSNQPPTAPTGWRQFFQSIPILGTRFNDDESYSSVIVDSNTLKEIFRCPGHLHSVAPDRKTAISSHPNGYAVWDIPGHPSWRTAVLVLIGWTSLWLAATLVLVACVYVGRSIWRSMRHQQSCDLRNLR